MTGEPGTPAPEDAPLLADGSAPASSGDLFECLDALGIAHHTVRHAAVFTVAEAKRVRGQMPGGHSKNLFLRSKKGRMWLVTCAEDAMIDLNALAERVGAGRFSFASPRRLSAYLGVIPGAVTPFAVINDSSGQVNVVLDRTLLAHDRLNFHPLDNQMTTAIAVPDLLRFLKARDHAPEIIDLPAK